MFYWKFDSLAVFRVSRRKGALLVMLIIEMANELQVWIFEYLASAISESARHRRLPHPVSSGNGSAQRQIAWQRRGPKEKHFHAHMANRKRKRAKQKIKHKYLETELWMAKTSARLSRAQLKAKKDNSQKNDKKKNCYKMAFKLLLA